MIRPEAFTHAVPHCIMLCIYSFGWFVFSLTFVWKGQRWKWTRDREIQKKTKLFFIMPMIYRYILLSLYNFLMKQFFPHNERLQYANQLHTIQRWHTSSKSWKAILLYKHVRIVVLTLKSEMSSVDSVELYLLMIGWLLSWFCSCFLVLNSYTSKFLTHDERKWHFVCSIKFYYGNIVSEPSKMHSHKRCKSILMVDRKYYFHLEFYGRWWMLMNMQR